MKLRSLLLFSVVLFLLFVPWILAHTPLKPSHGNESLATAYAISDPEKSWAIYAELHEGGEAQYYRLNMERGVRLRAMLFIPISEKDDFTPGLVVMGPGITSQDTLPEYVEAPGEGGRMLLEGQLPAKPTYEPFTPSSYYYIAELDLDVSEAGTYYLVVYEASQGGRYGVAVGYREEFGLDEWILVPIDVVGVHEWEGQSLFFILSPMLAVLVFGFVFIFWRRPLTFQAVFNWVGVSSALLYLGSGAMIIFQMILALTSATLDLSMVLSIAFALFPILLGITILRLAIKDGGVVTRRDRAYLALFGVLGVFAWAGLLIGPVLSMLTCVLPIRKRRD
jgi:hypothetical protein